MIKHYTKALPTTFAQAKLFTSCLYVSRQRRKKEWIIFPFSCTKLLFLLFFYKNNLLCPKYFYIQKLL